MDGLCRNDCCIDWGKQYLYYCKRANRNIRSCTYNNFYNGCRARQKYEKKIQENSQN